MTLRTRLASMERQLPRASVKGAAASPLPQVVAAVDAGGGRLPGESWADAAARLAGSTTRELLAHLKDRAHA